MRRIEGDMGTGIDIHCLKQVILSLRSGLNTIYSFAGLHQLRLIAVHILSWQGKPSYCSRVGICICKLLPTPGQLLLLNPALRLLICCLL